MCFCQPLGEHLGQALRDSPPGSSCGIPQLSLPTANTRASALSHSPEMWFLLVLLCSQGAAFSAGFAAPFTLGSEGRQHMKHRHAEDFMNVVSCGTFSAFLLKFLSQYQQQDSALDCGRAHTAQHSQHNRLFLPAFRMSPNRCMNMWLITVTPACTVTFLNTPRCFRLVHKEGEGRILARGQRSFQHFDREHPRTRNVDILSKQSELPKSDSFTAEAKVGFYSQEKQSPPL